MKEVVNAHQVQTSRCPSRRETHVTVVGERKYVACTPPGMSLEEHISNLIGDSFYGAGVDRYHPVSYTRPIDAKATSQAEATVQKIADDAYATSVALAKEAEQLLMKKELLEDPKLRWTPGLKETLVEETNKEIAQYNYTVGIQDTGQTEAKTSVVDTVVDAAKKSAAIPILIVVGVLAALYIFIFARRS